MRVIANGGGETNWKRWQNDAVSQHRGAQKMVEN
jgi:hypothetical protein